MIDVKNYAMLEKYIECGISKIIGKRFVNQDNIDKVMTKVLRFNDRYDPNRKMSYSSYIYMLVKSECYTIYSKSNRGLHYHYKKMRKYAFEKRPDIDRVNEVNESSMYMSDMIINSTDLLDIERAVLEKHYIQSITIRKIAEEFKLEKKNVYTIINQAIMKIRNKYIDLDDLKKEAELQHGKLID